MEASESQTYGIYAVMASRIRQNDEELLVKWQGLPLQEATWEPIGNLPFGFILRYISQVEARLDPNSRWGQQGPPGPLSTKPASYVHQDEQEENNAEEGAEEPEDNNEQEEREQEQGQEGEEMEEEEYQDAQEQDDRDNGINEPDHEICAACGLPLWALNL